MTNGTRTEPRFESDPAIGTEPFEPGDERARSAGRRDNSRSIASVLRELTLEGRDLMQLEMQLAKAEMREKVNVYERNMGAIAVGGALLLGTLLMAVVALNRGLTALLETWMAVDIAVWLAPLILAVVLGGIGWSMVKKGMNAIRHEGAMPHRTVETLREDKRWAERKVKHDHA